MRADLFFVTPIYRVLLYYTSLSRFGIYMSKTSYSGVQNDPENSLGPQPDFLNDSKPCTSTIAPCKFLNSANQTRTIANHKFPTQPDSAMSIPKHLKGLEIGARCHETGSSPPT